jgi:hypothetical protein
MAKTTPGDDVQTTYCSVADVEALCPSRKLGQGDNPTSEDVMVYIEGVESEINGALINKGYSVPISKEASPLAWQEVRRLTAQGAAAQLEAAAGNGGNAQRTETVFASALKKLIESRVVLDAPKDLGRAKPRGPGVTKVEPSCGNTPYFSRKPYSQPF